MIRKRKRTKEYKEKGKEELKKVMYKGKNLKYLYLIGMSFLIMLIFFVVDQADKKGISQEELDKQSELLELKHEKMEEGHIGGDELLITEEYKNEISTYDFIDFKKDNDNFFVYFYSPYCPYCESVGETIIDVLDESGETFIVVNVNNRKEFQERENAGTVPKLVHYVDGEVKEEIVGADGREVYEKMVNKHEGEEE